MGIRFTVTNLICSRCKPGNFRNAGNGFPVICIIQCIFICFGCIQIYDFSVSGSSVRCRLGVEITCFKVFGAWLFGSAPAHVVIRSFCAVGRGYIKRNVVPAVIQGNSISVAASVYCGKRVYSFNCCFFNFAASVIQFAVKRIILCSASGKRKAVLQHNSGVVIGIRIVCREGVDWYVCNNQKYCKKKCHFPFHNLLSFLLDFVKTPLQFYYTGQYGYKSNILNAQCEILLAFG